MGGAIIRRAIGIVVLAAAAPAAARTVEASFERVRSAVAVVEDVQATLEWPADATEGRLHLRAARLEAPELGYRLRALDWRCTLRRHGSGWRCEGPMRTADGGAQLAVAFDEAATRVRVRRGTTRIALDRDAATPDLTRIDLAAVPLAWAQALVQQGWSEGRLGGGELDATLAITAPADAPLRVRGPLELRGAAFDTPDGTLAGQGLAGRFELDLAFGAQDRARVDATLRSGELLFGTAYIAPREPVRLSLEAVTEGSGWRLPRFAWEEGAVLRLAGSGALDAGAVPTALDVTIDAPDIAPLRDRYLSGWLGVAGLADLRMGGAVRGRIALAKGGLASAHAVLDDVVLDDPRGRFAFEGLDGDVSFVAEGEATSALGWRGGHLYGLRFGAAALPLRSGAGVLMLREPVAMPMLGGRVAFDAFRLRPPQGERRLDVRFGLSLDGLQVEQLAGTLGWPAFGGELSGRIPQARYSNDRLDFDGGLAMSVFDGEVRVTSLAMERPFGTAPTLSADIELEGLDLHALTGVFDFGSITGRLDGRIDGLRLVDWTPVAFDARLVTRRVRGVPQRISQRAVQNISSVGDASLVTSLQGQLIRLFDDFGYRRIGLSCRLVDEVCEMDGLGSAGTGFIIVEGAGIPRLTVVGFNRRVDWPTLVERLAAAGTGDVSPVVE